MRRIVGDVVPTTLGLVSLECRCTISVVHLRGEVDASCIDAVQATLRAASARRNLKAVVVSLLAVRYFDSALLQRLMGLCRAAARADCAVLIVEPRYECGRRIIEIIELPPFVHVFDSLGDAVSYAQKPWLLRSRVKYPSAD